MSNKWFSKSKDSNKSLPPFQNGYKHRTVSKFSDAYLNYDSQNGKITNWELMLHITQYIDALTISIKYRIVDDLELLTNYINDLKTGSLITEDIVYVSDNCKIKTVVNGMDLIDFLKKNLK
jgi:hypothetical protein